MRYPPRLALMAIAALAALLMLAGCETTDYSALTQQAQETKAILQEQTARAVADIAALRAKAEAADPAAAQALRDQIAKMEIAAAASKAANDAIVDKIDKVLPTLTQAGSGDPSGTIAAAGSLLPPPWGQIVTVGGSLLLAGFLEIRRRQAAGGLTSLVKTFEMIKDTEAQNPATPSPLTEALRANAARIEANITDEAKAVIREIS